MLAARNMLCARVALPYVACFASPRPTYPTVLARNAGLRPLPPVRRSMATASRTPHSPPASQHVPESVPHDQPFLLPEIVSEALHVPMFSASAHSMVRVPSPRQFYSTLRHHIMKAQHRIFIATLYVGKEERELAMFLTKALARRPQLQLTILMDEMRATRESPQSASSASLLSHLASMFPDQVDLRLYATPVLRPNSIASRIIGKRFNEGFGLQHMKVYGFDDDVIITGANLSRDYFTRRMDRYLLIREHKPLANYLHALILLLSRFSYALLYDGDPSLLSHVKGHIEDMDDSSSDYVQLTRSAFRLHWDGGSDLLLAEDTDGTIATAGLCPSTRACLETNWRSSATQALQDFTMRWYERAKAQRPASGDTRIVPLLQLGQLAITQETDMIPILTQYLSALSPRALGPTAARPYTTVDLTSGYFTLSGLYKSLVLSDAIHRHSQAPVFFRLVAASPEANGFFGSRGLSGRIPAAYTLLEKLFWNRVVDKQLHAPVHPYVDVSDPISEGPLAPVELREWSKYGWTYHEKGLWITGPSLAQPVLSPATTLIGSSNYGARSEKFDVECSLLITTQSPQLQDTLAKEVQEMRESARTRMDTATFRSKERRVDAVTQVLTRLLRPLL